MALLVALFVVLMVGIRAANPPAALPASTPATFFSADRAMADVRLIAVRPHPTTSVDNARVRHVLADRLRALGLQPEERRYLIDPEGTDTLRRWSGLTDVPSEMTDLVAVLPGRDHSLPAVALMAHYDTVWGSPGSGDDSIGVATILEIVRAIRASGVPARDIVVLFTDGEEIGLSGAKAFWTSDGLAAHTGVVVNLEARGTGGRVTMFETGAANGAMVALLGQGGSRPVANSLAVMAYRLMPNDTDFTPVRERGVPGFNFAIMGRAAYYHSPRAMVDRLDPRSLQDMGNQALDLVAALAFARALPGRAPDAAFFDVAGHGLIHYPAASGWWVVLGAVLALGGAVVGVRRVWRLRPAEMLEGVGGLLWLVAQGLLALTAFNLLSNGAARHNYYDRLAALPQLETQALLLCVAALTGFAILRRFSYRLAGIAPGVVLAGLGWLLGAPFGLTAICLLLAVLTGWLAPHGGSSRWGGWIGAIGLLLLVAILLQIEAPMAAWLFAWPALVLGVVAALIAWIDPRFEHRGSWAIAAAGAALVATPLLPLAHLTFLGIGAPMPQAMAAFLAIVAAAFWPLIRMERAHRTALVAIAGLLAMAGAIAVQVRMAPASPTVPAYSLDK